MSLVLHGAQCSMLGFPDVSDGVGAMGMGDFDVQDGAGSDPE